MVNKLDLRHPLHPTIKEHLYKFLSHSQVLTNTNAKELTLKSSLTTIKIKEGDLF